MRISTSQQFQQSLNTMLNQQSTLANTQNEVSTGLRINVASDDPAGAAQVLAINHILAVNAQATTNINSANTRLSTETSSLSSVSTLLDRVNTLGLQGINGVLSDGDRANMAQELIQLRSNLVQLANSTDANGSALFAGTSTTATPFVLNSDGSVTYSGNASQQMVAVGGGLQLPNSDSGSAIFMQVPAGNGSFVASAGAANTGTLVVGANSVTDSGAFAAATAAGPIDYNITFGANGTWTATNASDGSPVIDASTGQPATGTLTDGGSISFNGISLSTTGTPAVGDSVSVQSGTTQDVFSTLTNMINVLQSGTGDSTTLNNVLNRQLESLNQAMDNVTNTQVEVGGRLDILQQQQSTQADLSVTYSQALSNVQSVDIASAVSNLTLQSTALQASQQVFTKVQGLSLFNFIQ
ncbi:MAG: flagellar hook-associated protein FlgL [Dyella sp.]